MKIKKIIIIISILLLTGCADYRELTDMAIVSTVAIDKKDNEYSLIVQILNSNTESSGEEKVQAKVMVYESKGKTLHEAFRNLLLDSPKKMYLGHVEVVILSESSIKEDLTTFFDFFLRDPEMEKDFKLLVAKDNSIKELMNVTESLVSIPAESVVDSITISEIMQGNVANYTFDEIVSNEIQEGIDPVIPAISIKKTESDNEEINPKERLILSKEMGIFANKKLIGYLDSSSTLGYNLLNQNTDSSVISFKCDKDNYATIELTKNKSKFSYDIKSNKLILDIDIDGSLSEVNCNIDVNKEESLKKLEKMLKNHMKDILTKTVNSIKEYNESDFLGIERYIYRNNYKYYKKNKKEIRENIKTIDSKFNIKILFNQTGLMRKGDEKY